MPVSGTTPSTKEGTSSPTLEKGPRPMNHGVGVSLETLQLPAKCVYQLQPEFAKSLGQGNRPLLKDQSALSPPNKAQPKIVDKLPSQTPLLFSTTGEVRNLDPLQTQLVVVQGHVVHLRLQPEPVPIAYSRRRPPKCTTRR